MNTTAIEQWLASQLGIDKYNNTNVTAGAAKYALAAARLGHAPVLPAELDMKLKDFTNRPKIAIFQPGVTINTERSIAGTFPVAGTSTFVQVTRNTFEAAFQIAPTLFASNAIAAQEAFNKNMGEAIKKAMQAMDLATVTAMVAGRTQVSNHQAPFSFNAATDMVDAPTPSTSTTAKDRIEHMMYVLNAARRFTSNNNHGEPIALICSTTLDAATQNAMFFGQNNDRDFRTLTGDAQVFTTSNLTTGAGDPVVDGKVYAIGDNALGLYTWISPEAQAAGGTIHGNRKVSTLYIPELGFNVEWWEEGDFANRSADAGGSKITSTTAYRIMFDYITIVSYVDDPATQATPIVGCTITAPEIV